MTALNYILTAHLQAVVGLGLNLSLNFCSNAWSPRVDDRQPTAEFVDFNKEPNKVFARTYWLLLVEI